MNDSCIHRCKPLKIFRCPSSLLPVFLDNAEIQFSVLLSIRDYVVRTSCWAYNMSSNISYSVIYTEFVCWVLKTNLMSFNLFIFSSFCLRKILNFHDKYYHVPYVRCTLYYCIVYMYEYIV